MQTFPRVKKLLFVVMLFWAFPAFAQPAQIPYQQGPWDPANLGYYINQLIQAIDDTGPFQNAFTNLDIAGNGATAVYPALTIVTAPGTPQEGLNIVQSGPSSGSTPGWATFNNIQVVFGATLTGSTSPGNPGCACYSGVNITNAIAGTAQGVEFYALSVGIVQTSADSNTGFNAGDKVGVTCGAETGYNSGSRFYGCVGSVVVTAGSIPAAIPMESDSEILVGATVPYRLGYNALDLGTAQASHEDVAYAVMSAGQGGSWQHAFALVNCSYATVHCGSYSPGSNGPALSTTGDWFSSEAPFTTAHFINLPNGTFTGYLFNFGASVAQLTGAGVLTITALGFVSLPTGTPATYACFTSGGALVSSVSAC